MLVLPHVATGVALGALIGDPLIVVPAAIASHFVLDSIPHWQETMAPYHPTWKTYLRIPIDIGLSIALTLYAIHLQPAALPAILLGAVFASIPDIDVITVKLPTLQRGIIKRYWDWHCRIQREVSTLWGVATQMMVLSTCILVIQTS
ncbi:MAG TPA: hypothetical protein VFS14_02345 [Candidatus Saccharimonadales bacterium]|nr:hypothetical protein [Candidatus Saccharimonadales bacterium]